MKIKEKIITLVEIMDSKDAETLFNYIVNNYQLKAKLHSWEDIEEIEPDDLDLEMLNAINFDSDCKEFITENELLKDLGLQKTNGK